MKKSTEQSQNTREHWISLYAAKITRTYKAIGHNSTWVREKLVFYFNCLVTKCFNASIDDESLSLLKKDLGAALKSTPLPLNKEERDEVCQIIQRLNRDDLHNRLMDDDKKELLKALCAYYPYGVKVDLNGMTGTMRDLRVQHLYNGTNNIQEIEADIDFFGDGKYIPFENFRPLLRTMESMTDEEIMEYKALQLSQVIDGKNEAWDEVDWLNARFLDYRGLIPRGMALEAKK